MAIEITQKLLISENAFAFKDGTTKNFQVSYIFLIIF